MGYDGEDNTTKMSKSAELAWQWEALKIILSGLERLPQELKDEMAWDIRNTFESLPTVLCAYKLRLAKEMRKAQQEEEKEHQEMLNSPEWQAAMKAKAEEERGYRMCPRCSHLHLNKFQRDFPVPICGITFDGDKLCTCTY